ncbi:MAG TPA: cytochrome c3 family protein, partial [Polyangiaceae bacterium]
MRAEARTSARAGLPHTLLAVCCALAAWLALAAPAALGAPGPGSSNHRPKGARVGDGGPSRAIFPPQRLPLKFSHRKHVGVLGVACVACHDRATASTKSSDRLLPAGTRCDGCHDTNHRDVSNVTRRGTDRLSACSSCHVGSGLDGAAPVVERVFLPAPNLKFDHALHAGKNIQCAECHGRVEEVDLATRDQLPRMKGCLSCHTGKSASEGRPVPSGACDTCHLTETNGRLKTHFASGALLPPDWMRNANHGPDWIERHKRVAAADSQFCGNCHSERECADCHDGRVRPRSVHPNDYLSLHGIEARQEPARCSSCHQQQSFCLGCHQRSGIAQSGPFANFAGRGRFHPSKWVWTDGPRSAGHHAWEAQKNLNTCTSCHVERDCVACHATRRVGGPGAGG